MKRATRAALVAACVLAACAGGWMIQSKGRSLKTGETAAAATAPSSPLVSRSMPTIQAGQGGGAQASLPIGAFRRGSQPEPFTYSRKEPPHKEGGYTLYPIDMTQDGALAAALGGHMDLVAPDGTVMPLTYDRHVSHGDGNWTWIGRLDGGALGQDAVITYGPEAAFGTLPAVNGMQLKIVTVHGHTYMAAAPLDGLSLGERAEGDTVSASPAPASSPTTSAGQVTQGSGSASDNPVDVLMAYTTGYRVWVGSASAAQTSLVNMIDIANRALVNSTVTNSAFRLVATMETNYADTNAIDTALSDLAGTSGGSTLSDVRSARDQYGADLVSLVRHFGSEQVNCGLAYIPATPYSAYANAMFSVVEDGSFDNGRGTTYCASTTAAHEMGHNLGAQHNHEQNATGGLYNYSYGYLNASAGFYDIMAYGSSGQEAELLYSTPDVATCKDIACGVANYADVARTLRETMPIAMNFRKTVVALADSSMPGQLMLANGTGRCLDATGGSQANGVAIQMWACNGLRQQQWGLATSNKALNNKDTALGLDAVGYGVSNGTPLQLWSLSGTSNQSWIFTRASLVANGGRVVDATGFGSGNGATFQLYDDLQGSNQSFTFDPSTGELRISTGRCLDVQGYGTANGTPVQLWDCNHTENQKFHFGPNGSLVGYGGNCLEAANGGTGNGTQVRMWQCNGLPHQKWRLRGQVMGVQSGLCLDDPAGGTQNGDRTQLWACLGNTHQRWEYQPN